MVAPSTRPKWKRDTHCIPMSGGVYLRGNNNRLFLKGKSLYPLLEHLIPIFNGNTPLEKITEGLDAEKKRMITNLIEKLFTHNFLKDTSQDQPHTLCQEELEIYAPDISFIDSFQPSAAYLFECFRNKRLLIIGSGHGFTSLIQASSRYGVKQMSVVMTPEGDTDSVARQEVQDVFARYFSEENECLLATPAWDNESSVRSIIQPADAILHIAERPMLARAQLLNRLCIEQQKLFIQAILVDNQIWIGPLVRPETEGCWECAWRRRQANLAHFSPQSLQDEFQDQPLVASGRVLTKSEATILANRLLFALFQHVTQAGSPETLGKLSIIDLTTFQSESHAFLPHPHCLACQRPVVLTAPQFLEQIQQLRHRDPLDPDILLEKIADCIDEKLGLFTAIDDSRFVQAPLKVYQAKLPNLASKECQSDPLRIVAVSTNTRDARIRITQKACECYAANLVDRRRLLPSEAVQQHSCPVLPADHLLGIKSFPREKEMWTWAQDLQTQQALLVPAPAVFSAFCGQERGIASGKTWEEAVCLALLDWCNYLSVGQLKEARRAYPQVDLERAPLTPEGTYLYGLFKAASVHIAIYDITGALRIPTFATCLGKEIVAYTTHCDVTQALCLGLEQALQQYQSEQFQEHDYAVPSVPDFPLNLRGDQWCVPHSTVSDTWPARLEWVLQQFQANGLYAFAALLDHDPAVKRIWPFIVRTLLSRRRLKKGE